MKFLKTVNVAAPEFSATFEREFRSQIAQMPLLDGCEAGGTPDLASVEIANLTHGTRDAQLLVRCTIYFSEMSRGGCADTIIREERAIPIELFIDKKTGAAYLNDG